MKLNKRFWANVQKTRSCWEWIRYKNTKGYGMITIHGKPVMAHRLSWEMRNGPIPEGLCACHHCDNPSCVNPGHIFIGTAQDNIRDSYLKSRRVDRLTIAQVKSIRCRIRAGERYKALAKEFGKSVRTIASLSTGDTWGWIDSEGHRMKWDRWVDGTFAADVGMYQLRMYPQKQYKNRIVAWTWNVHRGVSFIGGECDVKYLQDAKQRAISCLNKEMGE